MSPKRMTKRIVLVFFSLLLVMGAAVPTWAGQIFISDNLTAVAVIMDYQFYGVKWSNDAPQGSFGTVDLSLGEAYTFADEHLIVGLQTNNYADARAIIYLRNWDDSGDANDANPLCTLDNSVTEPRKGLIAMGTSEVDPGSEVLMMKWGREVIGTEHQITIPRATADQTTWQDGPGDGNWKWFLDETCEDDADFRLDTGQYGKLSYATVTTKAEMNWAGSDTVNVYLMAWFESNLPAGDYKTNTLTIEFLSE